MTYKVGIMSAVCRIKAPNPQAAALYFGLHTDGNMILGAVVYSCDDDPDFKSSMPFGKWLMNPKAHEDPELLAIFDALGDSGAMDECDL